MAELVSTALTTRQRVKDRLQITATSFDTLIDRLISVATHYLEKEAGRVFKTTTYTNEVYSVYGSEQPYILLKQAPVTALTSLQYRAGTVSTPNWTAFTTDEFELLEDGASGIVRIYGGAPKGVNTIRATYTAGYKIDFTDPANPSLHTLPHDITDLCEKIVTRLFKKREAEGKDQESFEGGSVTWGDLVDPIDRDVINRYRRLPTFV